ncbi:MAG: hypothetical protein DWI24_09480 [Planctomycetota bacterium]|nr:MAG: hypothetical protein DWI24_09480 [Planctomycetota bacterium]
MFKRFSKLKVQASNCKSVARYRKNDHVRKLSWLMLEERLQMAASINIPISDGPLIQAPVIESVNGVLSASVDMVRAGLAG